MLVLDAAVPGFSILLPFAVRFDPASLEHQLRILSEAIWVFIAVQRAGTVLRWMVQLPARLGIRTDAECFSQSGFTLPDSISRKRIVYRLVCSW